MKKVLIVFAIICILFAVYTLANKNETKQDIEVVGELIESIESNEQEVMVCTKQGSDFFTEQKIYIHFSIEGLVDEVKLFEKYSSREIAASSYDVILSNENNEEVILDGTTITYNATKTFGYEGKTKEEMIEIMNEYKTDGINTGYVITWE